MAENGQAEGIQVVSVNDDHTYTLNSEALYQVLLHGAARDRRVAVVSVAGAYRGGKSFILSFFLRYLRATPEQRSSGAWLGSLDTPLEGFKWRGGCDRHTTGLMFWSEPLEVVLSSGEKVAVIVMDTQGTFDSYSTVKDCSTIFALSTLVSSVQIYNIHQDLKEDSLQHLQLFTEYGRLVMDSGVTNAKPFQSMQFLIRDWMHETDHSFGYKGGSELLDKRLKIDSSQVEQLQEIRRHIISCFDKMKCFLMPHPGFEVSKPNFNGRLSDLRPEFRDCLLELIPAIFKPENLVLKTLNGVSLTGRDLLKYFESYMEVFNSSTLPEPTTIMQATAKASISAAIASASDTYAEEMNNTLSGLCLVPRDLKNAHEQAKSNAKDAFRRARKMGSTSDHNLAWLQLKEELDTKFKTYAMVNVAKLAQLVADAKQIYEEGIAVYGEVERICLHEGDLKELHENAAKQARAFFHNGRKTPSDINDDIDAANMDKELEARFRAVTTLNTSNELMASRKALEQYRNEMRQAVRSCLPAERLLACHSSAADAAFESFLKARSATTNRSPDPTRQSLEKQIEEQFKDVDKLNENQNKSAMEAALFFYNAHMSSVLVGDLCLHPADLESEQKRAVGLALDEFRRQRAATNAEDGEDNTEQHEDNTDEGGDIAVIVDECETSIKNEMADRYRVMVQINETNNNAALMGAITTYSNAMTTAACNLDKSWSSFLPWWFRRSYYLKLLKKEHNRAESVAEKKFREKRRRSSVRGPDPYIRNLETAISQLWDRISDDLYNRKVSFLDIVKDVVAVPLLPFTLIGVNSELNN